MKSRASGLVLLVITAVVASAPAQAQNGSLTRSFVSSSGVDTNPCTITQPCATFAHAYTAIGANGIIAALDPGKYGPITISTGLTINGNGWAAITAPAQGAGIAINVSSANVVLSGLEIDGAAAANTSGISSSDFISDTVTVENTVIRNCTSNAIYINDIGATVTLSGLELDGGAGIGADGILISTAYSVTIANSMVHNFGKNGIEATAGYLQIINTIATNNGYTGNFSGIYLHSGAQPVYATITGVTASRNGDNGIAIQNGVDATIFSSNASFNVTDGVLAQNNSVVVARDTVASGNGSNGFEAQSSAVLTLAHSVASENGAKDVYANGGTVNTYQDNNVTSVQGTLTPISAH